MKPVSQMVSYPARMSCNNNFIFHIKSLFSRQTIVRLECNDESIFIHVTTNPFFRVHNTSCFEPQRIHISTIDQIYDNLQKSQQDLIYVIHFLWKRRLIKREKIISGGNITLFYSNKDYISFNISKFSQCISKDMTHEIINMIIGKLVQSP